MHIEKSFLHVFTPLCTRVVVEKNVLAIHHLGNNISDIMDMLRIMNNGGFGCSTEEQEIHFWRRRRSFLDRNGNNLLHIHVAQLHSLNTNCPGCVTKYYKRVETLLKAGIDPTWTNRSGESVLHVLLKESRHAVGCSAKSPLLSCAKLIVPYFRGWRMEDEDLLKNLFEGCALPIAKQLWIELYQCVLENDVLDMEFVVNSGRTPWQQLLRGCSMASDDFPCSYCEPLSELCDLAIRRGCNVNSVIKWIVRNSIQEVKPRYTTNDCCYLSLLRVLLRYGVDIMPLVQLNPVNADAVSYICCKRVSLICANPLGPKLLYDICKNLFLYCPSFTRQGFASLISLCRLQDIEQVMKLCPLRRTPFSLQFLSKRVILRSLERKRVDALPLPKALKAYIMEDEVNEVALVGAY